MTDLARDDLAKKGAEVRAALKAAAADRILVLDPDPGCPARFVVDGCIEAAWDDSRGAAMLARGCDVVKRTRRRPGISPTRARSVAKSQRAGVGSR